jgi:thermostable 8-oxoguanine DNA glycosylase
MAHKTIFDIDIDISKLDYKYQDKLTPKLEGLSGDFDQSVINQIVLWKVNRYAEVNKETLSLLNSIKKSDKKINIVYTRRLLQGLLNTKGIRLPMASTILRFKNPNIYQIIDQRAYRLINEEELKLSQNVDEQIDLYIGYLNQLKKVCKKKEIHFSQADRILYLADKKINRKIPIKH